MKSTPANAPRNDTARMLFGCVCSLVALVLTAQPGDARAAAVPQSKEEQAKAWREIATLPDFWQGTWQSVSPIADDFPTPPDYTPAALDYIKKYKPVEDSPFANCKPLGLPFAMNIGGMPMKFFQSPGMIALYIESSGMTRFIHTDGREHSERPNPTYLGESIGHWEGDTLVVDTTGFAPDTLFQMGKLDKALTQGDPSPLSGVIFGPARTKSSVSRAHAAGRLQYARDPDDDSRRYRLQATLQPAVASVSFAVSSAETTRRSGLARTTGTTSTRRPASWNTT